jgi:hypothetical protein
VPGLRHRHCKIEISHQHARQVFGVLKMHDRTRRALAAVAEMDKQSVCLCPTCEGLLTAAAGLPLPLVRDEDGEMTDGETYVNAMIDRILKNRAPA